MHPRSRLLRTVPDAPGARIQLDYCAARMRAIWRPGDLATCTARVPGSQFSRLPRRTLAATTVGRAPGAAPTRTAVDSWSAWESGELGKTEPKCLDRLEHQPLVAHGLRESADSSRPRSAGSLQQLIQGRYLH
jgi:hypothetical protein